MEGKFIYVFDDDTRDLLIENNYKLMCSKHGIYIFENNLKLNFAKADINCVYSDTLTF